MRKLVFFALLAAALFINACSSGGGSDTPSDTEPHPQSWFSTHPDEADERVDYSNCSLCHGADLSGSGDAVSCYRCHSYNTEPPFSFHPPAWTDAYPDHRAYAALNGYQSCKSCHSANLKGYQTAPSCYSTSFNGLSCHADGPQGVPHPLDSSYLSGTMHGPDAKADLTSCQQCHGEAGGPGSNPHFNIGIFSAGGHGCESCHGVDYAHPQNWAGPNNTFHYSAGNIQNSCTLCHGENLDGDGGVGVSCVGCHISATTFNLDCSYCHGYPPDGTPDLDVPIPVPHHGVAEVSYHVECFMCHGLYESGDSGRFAPASNYTLFNYSTDTNGEHWDGNIDMNALYQYNSENYGCDTASCHGNDPEHRLSDSGLPVFLKNFFGGE